MLPALIDAGIDCIEHGTGLTTDLIDAMVAHGTALVPTAIQLDNFPEYAEAGRRQVPGVRRHDPRPARAGAATRSWRPTKPASPIYAGTDAGGVLPHGGIADEVPELAAYGIPVEDALRGLVEGPGSGSGSTPLLDEGAPADFVVYDADPRQDVTVLAEPARVVLRGAVVA